MKRRILPPVFVIGVFSVAFAWAALQPVKTKPAAPLTIDARPLRGELQPLRLRLEGVTSPTYECQTCHGEEDPPKALADLVPKHAELKLIHGRNNDCLHCHHPDNRNVYVDHGGQEIPANDPARLCGKCHGLIHRNWVDGLHGRLNGYWDQTQGAQQRLQCSQCHDPHRPKFPLLKPMPGPKPVRGQRLPHLAPAPKPGKASDDGTSVTRQLEPAA